VDNGCYMFIFTGSHQDPGNAVLDVLQFLDVLASDPSEDGITVV